MAYNEYIEKHWSAIEYTNTSRVIFKGACLLSGIIIAGDGAQADCQVYDGVNSKAPIKLHMEALNGTTFNFFPVDHVRFNYGIYVAVNAATTKVSICYDPIKK